jgi:hypothetical protein
MHYRITGLDIELFRPLFGLPEADLAARGVERRVVDACPGFPDRIEMRDAAVGETILLLNHTHQPADTPFHSSHAVFVREAAEATWEGVDEVPEVMRRRLLSVRAFDREGMMIAAEVVAGAELEPLIARFLDNPTVAYLHAHYAAWGCYAARIDRA